MRTIKFILQKEFKQIFRNKSMLPIIFVVPFIQLIVLVHAATFEMQNINMIIVDNDLSTVSRKLTNKFEGSKFFNLVNTGFSVKEAEKALYNNTADLFIVIPSGFEKKLVKENKSTLQLNINAINSIVAGLSNYYANSIIMSLNKEIIIDWYGVSKNKSQFKQINIEYSHWYNPQLNYKTYMVPGILVLLITIIGLYLSGMNLVREKEIGTIEQINVTPIRKHQFIIGKLLPFWIIGMFELAFGLVLGKLLFDIPIVGNLFLIFGVASIYLLVILGIGLLISTVTENQLQAMFFSFFFSLVFILMSGLFTAVESMPEWGQFINKINPIAYFIRVMRMVLLKGAEIKHVITEIIALVLYATAILSLATWRYKKTV